MMWCLVFEVSPGPIKWTSQLAHARICEASRSIPGYNEFMAEFERAVTPECESEPCGMQ